MENKKVNATEVVFRNQSRADTSPTKEFFKSINNKLQIEFEKTITAYKDAEQYLFNYGERALLGIYVNALIRGDEMYNFITLQEYRVEDKDNTCRCDLLVSKRSKAENMDIIFEAKKCTYSKKEYDESQQKITKGYIEDCYTQGEKYFESEKEYFLYDTYIIVLIFDSIHVDNCSLNLDKFKFNQAIEKLKNYNPNNQKDDIDFYSFFYIEEISGLQVYGSVKKVLEH